MGRTARKRSEVEDACKWKLEDLYPDREAWQRDLAKLRREVRALGRDRGKMGRSAKGLADCLNRLFGAMKRLYRLNTYAGRVHDQDARDPEGQEISARIQRINTEVDAALAFVEPEILAIAPARLKTFLKSKRLADYRHYVHNITRRRKHVRTSEEEELIARTGNLASVPADAYNALGTVNMPFPEVTLENGEKVVLTQAAYARHRDSASRDERLHVFQAFFGTYKRFRETLAALLAGAVSRDRFGAQARRYKSDLHGALDGSNVPVAIYANMIEQVREGLPLLWRSLKLRKRMLGLAELGYHDMYASVIPAVRMDIPFDAARSTLLEALRPLGEEYVATLDTAFGGRWMDVYPTRDKRSGAYSAGEAYDVHPYVLLNYNDDYESLTTTAHELGHALHSHLSNSSQPFAKADYPIFVAEVASIVNEHLLRLHLQATTADRERAIFLLGQHLDNFRQTVFRQAMFAEFELGIHELAQDGEPITADALDEVYLELLRAYYGEAEGLMQIHPLYAVEWAYIPHFYYNFYVFQYTTSFIAATAIADRIHAGDEDARDRYLKMLKAGGSKYPVQLLKLAGVDMGGPQPYRQAFRSMAQAIDEIEKLT